AELEPFKEFEVGEGKIVDAVVPLRPWLARKARVYRCQDVRTLCYCLSEARHGLRSATTMQDENGATAPSLVDAHCQSAGEGFFSSSGRRRRESTHVIHPFCWVHFHRSCKLLCFAQP